MNLLAPIVVGFLFGTSIFLLLCRTPVKLIIGLVLLSNAINLLIFVAAGLTRGYPPLIAEGQSVLTAPYADPLPQALILTAIVISFGVLAFALVLFSRTFRSLDSDHLDEMKATDT
ncbi:MAG TPA: Na+/H+ antiporter subunit C [Desulfobacterales bacterium]|mgnify:CR=1 FL=1|jgi:multicomponent Na+:H+ antiporter subunit C